MKIHLAAIGHIYERVRMSSGDTVLRCVSVVSKPITALCGVHISEGKKTIMVWDAPESCRICLKKMLETKPESVQPILLPSVDAA